ncbi:integral membrane protein [Pseudomonas sp. FH1]|nr:integral membrane protein [Pseudomonas sp. FH1]
MLYLLFLLAHLFAALIFIGTVFFEVLILARLHHQLPARVMVRVEQGVGQRAKVLMPWVLLVLFGAGLAIIAGFLLTAVQTWTGRPGLSGGHWRCWPRCGWRHAWLGC